MGGVSSVRGGEGSYVKGWEGVVMRRDGRWQLCEGMGGGSYVKGWEGVVM